MFHWSQTGRVYIMVIYNLRLMLVSGATSGLWMERIPDVFGYEVREIKNFDDGTERGEKI